MLNKCIEHIDRLVCAKGTDIIIITVHKDATDGDLSCVSCELGPSCHGSPITSLQCISHKYVLTASRAATQYFDIENESVHLCENNILRGKTHLNTNFHQDGVGLVFKRVFFG